MKFLSLCPLITRLAGSLDNLREDMTKVPILKPMEYFDTARLSRMQIILTEFKMLSDALYPTSGMDTKYIHEDVQNAIMKALT